MVHFMGDDVLQVFCGIVRACCSVIEDIIKEKRMDKFNLSNGSSSSSNSSSRSSSSSSAVRGEVEVGLTGLGKGSSHTLQWRPPSRSPPSILLPLLNITAVI